MKILTFILNREKYAIGVDMVSTIENVTQITPIPKSKEIIIGLISSRGCVIPVINTNLLLNNNSNNDFNKFIITNIKDEKLALAVDDIEDVLDIEESDIEFINKDSNISVVTINSAIITLLNKNQLEAI